jgi:hypothetical protein
MRPYGGKPPQSSSACPHSPTPFRTPSRRITDLQTGQEGINASVQRTSRYFRRNAARAQRKVSEGHTRGKIVLIVDEDLAAQLEV